MSRFAANVKDPMLRDAIASGRLVAIAGIGACGIIGILTLAVRTEQRATRAIKFVAVAEAALNRDPALVARAGRVVAGGRYQLTFDGNRVDGWFNVEAPTRGVSGRATVAAERAGMLGAWTLQALEARFDSAALSAANAQRELIAVEAGYRQARRPGAAEEGLPPGRTVGGDETFQVVPSPRDAAAAQLR